jgi:hypothetical protein
MSQRKKRKDRMGRHGILNAVVVCLVILVVFLGAIAAWIRYTGQPLTSSSLTDPADAIENRVGASWSNSRSNAGILPVGNRGFNGAPMCTYFCSRCQSSCWSFEGRWSPACPFCGVLMSRGGVRGIPVGVSPGGSATWPIPIVAGAPAPHGNRGACAKCHTVSSGGLPPTGMIPSGAAPKGPAGGAGAVPGRGDRPALIREFGIEASRTQGAGVKVTGVMGNSHASRGGMKAGDVILRCNGSRVADVGALQKAVSKAAPEADAQITVLRNGRTRDLSVMVGEGEMEGFTPIGKP